MYTFVVFCFCLEGLIFAHSWDLATTLDHFGAWEQQQLKGCSMPLKTSNLPIRGLAAR